jgi:hypothetical protein
MIANRVKQYISNPLEYTLSEIDSLEHDTSIGIYNSIVQIDATHYLLAYSNSGVDGVIKTFSVDANADNITEIDSVTHDTGGIEFNSLVKIDDTHYILAYKKGTLSGYENGYLKTFSIDGSYNITELNSLKHTDSYATANSLIKIDATHFMLAYGIQTYGGFIKTFSIDGSYAITEIDAVTHDGMATDNSLVSIDATHFMLGYAGLTSDNAYYCGIMKTFSIDGSYNITEIDALEFGGNATVVYNSLVKISATHYMVASMATGNDFNIFSIDGSYNISYVSSLDTASSGYDSLVQIDNTHFMLAYVTSSKNVLKVYSIDGSYAISEIAHLDFDTYVYPHNSLFKINTTHYILGYAGPDKDGFIKTFLLS